MREPMVSAVIPTYRRPDLLERCLRALCGQTLPGHAYEIIVADDGCEQRILRLVEALAVQYPDRQLRYVAVSGTQGPAGARNAGWQAARAEVVAFTDDDTVPASTWLREGCIALADDPHASAAVGQVTVPLPDRPTDHERDTGGLATAEFVTANCFVRRSALLRIGGFDERFTRAWREDSDLQFRLLAHGGRIACAPAAVVEHPVRPARWGSSVAAQSKVYFDALLYKKHPQLYRQRIRPVPPWRYYWTVLALVAAPLLALAGLPWPAALAALAWLGLTAGFAVHRLRGAALTPRHVAEMIVTSAVIPPLSVYWRLRGALAFRVMFL